MRTRTKIILGLILFLPVLFGIAFVGGTIWSVIDPEGQEKYLDELEAERKADERKAKETQQEKSKSVMLSETIYENMVLNYKGKDGTGFSIKDFSDARCRDNQSSFAQYLGDDFDDKSNYHHVAVHSPVNIDLNPPCLGAMWHFGVNNQGNVIAWDYSAERQDILDYLDTQGKN